VGREGKIRLYIADDHPVFLDGLVRTVRERPELELVGQGRDGREALADLARMRPDVAVIDLRMRGLSGTEVLRAARRDGLETRIILLSADTESESVYSAVAAGAAGYLSKESDREEILDAVSAAARGEAVLSPDVHTGLAAAVRRREAAPRPVMTAREREILALTAEGRSAPEIARDLHLSPATVKGHLQSLYEKLGVSDRAAAVAAAMRRGLLE
jgi:two-component system, NarL family, nitrate/nitrite response regulator NarL